MPEQDSGDSENSAAGCSQTESGIDRRGTGAAVAAGSASSMVSTSDLWPGQYTGYAAVVIPGVNERLTQRTRSSRQRSCKYD